jgi:hypothetical protein
MKKGSKVKFGGGKFALGKSVLNHFSDWGGSGDAITVRELQKSSRRVYLRALKEINKTSPDFYPTADLALGMAHPDRGIGPTIHHDFSPDLDLNTGFYKLKYGEETTQKIKFFANSEDIDWATYNGFSSNNRGLDSSGFMASSNGDLVYQSYGPYTLEADSTGKRDFVEIIDQSNPEVISGSITGYDGSNGGYSTQSLVFTTPQKTKTINLTFSGLNPYSIYETQSQIFFKDISIGRTFSSGTIPQIVRTEAENTGKASISYTIPKGMVATPKFYLSDLQASMHPLLNKDPASLDEEFNILDWSTGYARVPQDYVGFPLVFNEVYSVDDSYSLDDFWHYEAADSFSGSHYHSFSNVTISNSSTLERFIIHHDRSSCMDYCENLELVNNPNLTDICIPALESATGINFSGCNINSFNSGSQLYPKINGTYDHGKYSTLMIAPNARSFNVAGNDLDEYGIWNVCNALVALNKYSGISPQGYLNLKDQTSYTPPNFVVSGLINTLSGRNWIVEYDNEL